MGKPQVGDWYQNEDKGEPFQRVSVDGAFIEDWDEMPLVTAAALQDWTGPLDDIEPDEVAEDDFPSDA